MKVKKMSIPSDLSKKLLQWMKGCEREPLLTNPYPSMRVLTIPKSKKSMKSYTDIEQSKKLAEILPLESADMCYDGYALDNNGNHPVRLHKPDGEYDTPCWSLAALLGVLPSATLDSSNDHHYRLHCMERYTEWYDNPVAACVAMIKRLHELNLL